MSHEVLPFVGVGRFGISVSPEEWRMSLKLIEKVYWKLQGISDESVGKGLLPNTQRVGIFSTSRLQSN